MRILIASRDPQPVDGTQPYGTVRYENSAAQDAAKRREEDISQHVVGPETASKRPGRRPSAEAFEVALSFAA